MCFPFVHKYQKRYGEVGYVKDAAPDLFPDMTHYTNGWCATQLNPTKHLKKAIAENQVKIAQANFEDQAQKHDEFVKNNMVLPM